MSQVSGGETLMVSGSIKVKLLQSGHCWEPRKGLPHGVVHLVEVEFLMKDS